MSPPTLPFLNLPLESTLTRLMSLDRLPLDVYLCTHLISFPISRPLWGQEEPVCPTPYVIHGNHSFTPGFIRRKWWGAGEARQAIVGGRDSRCLHQRLQRREKSPDPQINSLTRSQAVPAFLQQRKAVVRWPTTLLWGPHADTLRLPLPMPDSMLQTLSLAKTYTSSSLIWVRTSDYA